jgi:hypothetical protein
MYLPEKKRYRVISDNKIIDRNLISAEKYRIVPKLGPQK